MVGSGAGGGPVAANLAEAGPGVLLLEAGGDPVKSRENRLPEEYEVPGFHPLASENEAMKWDFYVRHSCQQRAAGARFSYASATACSYPRAGTLGGCTAHNAIILVYPHDADWNHIAEITGDPSWKARNMHKFFRRSGETTITARSGAGSISSFAPNLTGDAVLVVGLRRTKAIRTGRVAKTDGSSGSCAGR